MFITERLVGVSIFSLLLGFICLLILFSKKEKLGKILFLYTILLTLMAYFFVPNPGADLYRIVPIMNAYANTSLTNLKDLFLESNTPVTILYLYMIGSFNKPGLLPAITTFIFFINIFYIIKKSALKFGSTSNQTALILFLFMSSGIFFEVISGIRTMLAFSIIGLCFFKEVVEKKSFLKNVLWYMTASLIHPAAFVLSIIRVLFLIIQAGKPFKSRFIYIILSGFIIIGVFTYGNKYFQSMIETAGSYINSGTYSYVWEYIIGLIILIYIIWIQIIYFRIRKKESKKNGIQNIWGFSLIISFLVILLYMEYNTFHRFILLNSILAIPITLYILGSSDFQIRQKKYFKLVLFFISTVLLLLACSRGNLSSLKFFVI